MVNPLKYLVDPQNAEIRREITRHKRQLKEADLEVLKGESISREQLEQIARRYPSVSNPVVPLCL